jgi:hypothetical protein
MLGEQRIRLLIGPSRNSVILFPLVLSQGRLSGDRAEAEEMKRLLPLARTPLISQVLAGVSQAISSKVLNG